MKIIPASFEILDMASGSEILKKIELAGRTCYKSEYKINDGSAQAFCGSIIKSGHESVLEHASATVRIICDRGISHELITHRTGFSKSQESTRYCNYGKDKFGNEVTDIKPFYFPDNSKKLEIWLDAMRYAEKCYFALLDEGATPQEARTVLSIGLKTEIVITANMREWRHIFKLRCSAAAHPQMREIMLPLLQEFHKRVPVLFEDIYQYGIENGWYQV